MKQSILCNSLMVQSLIDPLKRYEFSRNNYRKEVVITPEELTKEGRVKIALTSSGDYTIKQILKDFGATESGIITNMPKEYEVVKMDEALVIKYGKDIEISSILIAEAKFFGIVCGFNDESFIICASKKYEFVFDEIVKMIRPGECKFTLNPCHFMGKTLLISTIS